jgi:hypothetical protein
MQEQVHIPVFGIVCIVPGIHVEELNKNPIKWCSSAVKEI